MHTDGRAHQRADGASKHSHPGARAREPQGPQPGSAKSTRIVLLSDAPRSPAPSQLPNTWRRRADYALSSAPTQAASSARAWHLHTPQAPRRLARARHLCVLGAVCGEAERGTSRSRRTG